jgi:hypothetical protein
MPIGKGEPTRSIMVKGGEVLESSSETLFIHIHSEIGVVDTVLTLVQEHKDAGRFRNLALLEVDLVILAVPGALVVTHIGVHRHTPHPQMRAALDPDRTLIRRARVNRGGG